MRCVAMCRNWKCIYGSRTRGRVPNSVQNIKEPTATAGWEGSDELGLVREAKLGGRGDLSENAYLRAPWACQVWRNSKESLLSFERWLPSRLPGSFQATLLLILSFHCLNFSPNGNLSFLPAASSLCSTWTRWCSCQQYFQLGTKTDIPK